MALPSGPMLVSTPTWANPGATFARTLVVPLAKIYFGWIADTVDSIQADRAGKKVHLPTEYNEPSWNSVEYYS